MPSPRMLDKHISQRHLSTQINMKKNPEMKKYAEEQKELSNVKQSLVVTGERNQKELVLPEIELQKIRTDDFKAFALKNSSSHKQLGRSLKRIRKQVTTH